MSILVTGGAGFIGSFTARRLVDREEDVVLTIHRSPPTLLKARGPYENVLDKVKIAKGDVTDMSFIIETIKKYGVERIIHTVAAMSKPLQVDPSLAVRLNIRGDINVLEAARLLDIERVTYTSTVCIYGDPSDRSRLAKEDDPIPIITGKLGVYGAGKIFTEITGLNYQEIYGLDFVALRLLGPYGPGRGRGAIFNMIREVNENAPKGKPIRIKGRGNFMRDYNYVEDTAEACVLACFTNGLKNQIFNVSSEEPHCLFEVRDIVMKVIPNAVFKFESGFPEEPFLIPASLDISRAKKELGWKLQYSFEEGIKKYMAWFLNKSEV